MVVQRLWGQRSTTQILAAQHFESIPIRARDFILLQLDNLSFFHQQSPYPFACYAFLPLPSYAR